MSGKSPSKSNYSSIPRKLTDEEKLQIYYFPQLEEDIRPRYKRLRDETFQHNDLKIGTIRNDYRIMLIIIKDLMECDNVIRCIHLERQVKALTKRLEKPKVQTTVNDTK